ncbi:MAG: fructose-specific PTS transporter subunit EIIC [Acutalibacteraceae bacterium]
MKITDLLKLQSIELQGKVQTKEEAIEKLVELQCAAGHIADRDAYIKGIWERENTGSTAVGDGIAIPHCKSDAVKTPGLAAMVVRDGVDYGAMDGKPSDLLFMIAAPTDGDVHLEVLSRLMTMLMDESFRAQLLAAPDKESFLAAIDAKEREKYPEEAAQASRSGYRILAVTACPTGIAHTYMAAEALEAAGKKLGYPLKAETNGSGGAKNVLTAEEIAAADGIIIAADKSVDMARFDGKPLLSVKVADGIHKPEELIRKIENGEAPVYHHKGGESKDSISSDESFGRQIYKHLMNGVSHMLPFVVAGGIFIAIAFLIDTLTGAPQDSNFGMHSPAAAFFKTIGGYAFNIMVPILSGYIAMSIADRPGLLVGLVGGFLATAGSTFALPGGDIASGFLGALVAGFVGGYMMLGIRKLCDHMPKSLEGIKSVLIYPLLGLGGVAVLMCAINPIMGFINTAVNNWLASLADNPALGIVLGCILAGMMAIDMGGPFNKAAYVFGTASLTTAATLEAGGSAVMAAVMIGGMVPPIAIALCTTFFKNRFTAEEKKNGIVNYIMGLSFITEGAIPYAAADPLRVIPSCVIGAAVAGGLSTAFGCTLMAPHGGVFVFALVHNWPMYLLSLAIGSVVGMLLLALLKKPVNKKA